MDFESIRVPKVSDTIVEQLEDMILKGILRPGDRLPSERDLAVRLDVSRPSLREAIVIMEARGLLQTRRGGGTFVCDVTAHTITDPLVHLLKSRPEAAVDFLELRLALEEVAAFFAAARATEADKAILARRFEALVATYRDEADTLRSAEADVEFHMAIADASHNLALVHVMRGLFNLLRVTIHENLKKIFTETDGKSVVCSQHQVLFDALIAGDPEAAREAAHTHLAFVLATLRERNQEAVREEVSRRRLRTLGP